MANCIIVDDEPIARDILETYLLKTPTLNLVKSCKNVNEALNVISKNSIDLLFLDINMPQISGLTFAKVLDKNIKIIFTTAYREYAVDGFEIDAVDYLLKPFSFDRFDTAVTKFLALNTTDNKDVSDKKNKVDFIFVRSERKMIKVDLHSIFYIESLTDYIKIHTSNGIIVVRETISKMEEKLSNEFIRVHRSFIISITKIESYTNEFVEVNKKAIPVSRTYKENVLKRLEGFK